MRLGARATSSRRYWFEFTKEMINQRAGTLSKSGKLKKVRKPAAVRKLGNVHGTERRTAWCLTECQSCRSPRVTLSGNLWLKTVQTRNSTSIRTRLITTHNRRREEKLFIGAQIVPCCIDSIYIYIYTQQ